MTPDEKEREQVRLIRAYLDAPVFPLVWYQLPTKSVGRGPDTWYRDIDWRRPWTLPDWRRAA